MTTQEINYTHAVRDTLEELILAINVYTDETQRCISVFKDDDEYVAILETLS